MVDIFGETSLSRRRAIALLVVGAAIGALMITPGVTHVTDSLRHVKQHLDGRYVQTVQGHDLFALVDGGFGGGIAAKAGPVRSVDQLGTGEYRVRFTRPFNLTSGEVFAVVSAITTAGTACSWHYHGTARKQLRVKCFNPNGAAANTNFTLAVFHRA